MNEILCFQILSNSIQKLTTKEKHSDLEVGREAALQIRTVTVIRINHDATTEKEFIVPMNK